MKSNYRERGQDFGGRRWRLPVGCWLAWCSFSVRQKWVKKIGIPNSGHRAIYIIIV